MLWESEAHKTQPHRSPRPVPLLHMPWSPTAFAELGVQLHGKREWMLASWNQNKKACNLILEAGSKHSTGGKGQLQRNRPRGT